MIYEFSQFCKCVIKVPTDNKMHQTFMAYMESIATDITHSMVFIKFVSVSVYVLGTWVKPIKMPFGD